MTCSKLSMTFIQLQHAMYNQAFFSFFDKNIENWKLHFWMHALISIDINCMTRILAPKTTIYVLTKI